MTWLIEEWMALGGGAKNSPGHGFSLEGACVLFSVSARRLQGAHGDAVNVLVHTMASTCSTVHRGGLHNNPLQCTTVFRPQGCRPMKCLLMLKWLP